MPVIFSRACEYGLRAVVEMARDYDHKVHLAQNLAKRLDIPAPFLAKILQLLVKKGILNSSKGRGGGFSFARPAREIRLIEIVDAIDGTALTQECAMGLPSCGDANPCPIHHGWAPIRHSLVELLSSKTVENVAKNLAPLMLQGNERVP